MKNEIKPLNVMSCFSGLGCGELALKKAGIPIKQLNAFEVDKYAKAVYRKHNPEYNLHDDIRQWDTPELKKPSGYYDLIMGGSPCFPPGHFVMTIDGMIPIEQVTVGQLVLTHTGKWQKVLKVGVRTVKKLYRLNGMGFDEILSTDNHPFYTRKRLKRKIGTQRFFGKAEWIEMKDLDKSYYLGSVCAEDLGRQTKNTHFWMLIALFIACGELYTEKKRRVINIKIQTKYADIITEIFKEMKLTHEILIEKDYTRLLIYNRVLWHYLSHCGDVHENRCMPAELWKAPLETQTLFLTVYKRLKSCSNKRGEYRMVTPSKRLAYELEQLIMNVYRVSAFLAIQKPIKYVMKTNYHITFFLEMSRQSKVFYDNIYAWKPIRKITQLDEHCYNVYNLEVENDNSYTINGVIVHNCQDISVAGKRSGLSGERSGLFYVFADILKYYKPKYFLFENVASMRKEIKDIITDILGVEPVMIDGELVSAQSRKRLWWTNIPNITLPEDKGIILQDIILSGEALSKETYSVYVNAPFYPNKRYPKRTQVLISKFNNIGSIKKTSNRQGERVYSIDFKSIAINAISGCTGGTTGLYLDDRYSDLCIRKLHPIEVERLFNIQDDYTKYGIFIRGGVETVQEISATQRYKMLGNGWVVDIPAHIFSILKGVLNEKTNQ